MHLFFVINRNASAVANQSLEAITQEFERIVAGIMPDAVCEYFFPETPEELRERLEERLQMGGVDRVVACGGDGTITEMLSVLVRHTDVPMAIVPMGTGNLLAINLEIPFAFDQALQIALSGGTCPVDVGRLSDGVHDELFILNASVGLDAEIMASTDKELKRRWGWLAYFIKGIPMLPSVRRAYFRIVADGRAIHTRAIGITISNAGSKVTGGIQLCPGTVLPNDGLLHGTIFKPRTAWDYITNFVQLVLMSLIGKRPDTIHFFNARKITISCKPAMKTQVDGNVIGETPVTIELIDPRLQICVPANPEGQGLSVPADNAPQSQEINA